MADRRSFVKAVSALFTKQILPVAARPVGVGGATSLWGIIRESFTGAWQRNVVVESLQNLLAFSAVYSCISLISNDISKLRIKLIEQDPEKGNIWVEVTRNSPYAPVLNKPNRYQTRIQFLSQWIISKLVYGNCYCYKERDQRGIVTDLYILDPRLVTPLVANDGSVWYRVGVDYLAGISVENTLPASEIIHDRGPCLFHPLIGVPPIFACGVSTTQGLRIQNNSEQFFRNMSMPSGQLTSPNLIDDVTAERLKKDFEAGTTGPNIGRLFVGGDGLKYEPFGMVPPQQAQLIEQLRWTVSDVARCFAMPEYKIGGEQPKFSNATQADLDYYKQCLQNLIEALELCLEEGLGLDKISPTPMAVELDLDGLLRMDPSARAETNAKRISAGYLMPDEARFSDNLGPVPGGDTPYMQQQNWPLAQLASRPPPDTQPTPTPPASAAPAATPQDTPATDTPSAKEMLPAEDRVFLKYIERVHAFEEFATEIREELEAQSW